jgi:hypothetical protein
MAGGWLLRLPDKERERDEQAKDRPSQDGNSPQILADVFVFRMHGLV